MGPSSTWLAVDAAPGATEFESNVRPRVLSVIVTGASPEFVTVQVTVVCPAAGSHTALPASETSTGGAGATVVGATVVGATVVGTPVVGVTLVGAADVDGSGAGVVGVVGTGVVVEAATVAIPEPVHIAAVAATSRPSERRRAVPSD